MVRVLQLFLMAIREGHGPQIVATGSVAALFVALAMVAYFVFHGGVN